jgi:hypothetical protein
MGKAFGGINIKIARDILIIILSLSGIVAATTIKAINESQYPDNYTPTLGDYRKALQEMAEREIRMALSVLYEMFEAGEVIAFSPDPEEKKKALAKIETSNQKLDTLATGYQKNLEVLQEKMEKQMEALTTTFEATLAVNQSITLDSFTLRLKEVKFEQLQAGQLDNEILLELTGGEGASIHRLRGGEEFEYNGYIIKYSALIFNEETKGFEVKLRVMKSSL